MNVTALALAHKIRKWWHLRQGHAIKKRPNGDYRVYRCSCQAEWARKR